MAIFTRRETPPRFRDFRRYIPHLRKDFIFQCAYCERTESYFGGQEAFEIDHFRPFDKFKELRNTYENLYYVCGKCNRHKSDSWPSDDQISQGSRFADPCVEDPYVDHLREIDGGGLEELTPCGVYSNAHVRLDRPELKAWRSLRRQARDDLPVLIAAEDTLRRALLMFPSEQRAIQTQMAALGRRIEETRTRFSLG
jgi:hypothetical protein